MSKRTGKAVTMRDLMDEVGTDAVRYFFTMRSSDAHLDFDMDLAVSKSNENPVFYVQYAHARICSIFRQADEAGLNWSDAQANLSLLMADKELELLKKVAAFPEEVTVAAEQYAPHRIVRFVYDLAALFHSYYNAERVIVDDRELAVARLQLLKAVQITLSNGLKAIGVSAPEKM